MDTAYDAIKALNEIGEFYEENLQNVCLQNVDPALIVCECTKRSPQVKPFIDINLKLTYNMKVSQISAPKTITLDIIQGSNMNKEEGLAKILDCRPVACVCPNGTVKVTLLLDTRWKVISVMVKF